MHEQGVAISRGKVNAFERRDLQISSDAKQWRIRTHNGTIRVGHMIIQSARRGHLVRHANVRYRFAGRGKPASKYHAGAGTVKKNQHPALPVVIRGMGTFRLEKRSAAGEASQRSFGLKSRPPAIFVDRNL